MEGIEKTILIFLYQKIRIAFPTFHLVNRSITDNKKENHSSKSIPTGVNYPERISMIVIIARSRNQAILGFKKSFW